MLVSLSFTKELLSLGADRSLRILYIRVAFEWKRLVSRVSHFKLCNTSADLTSQSCIVIGNIDARLILREKLNGATT